MTYKKLSLLLVISLVFLLLVSLGLICTWFYYYFYNKDSKPKVEAAHSRPASQEQVRDSLQRVYLATLGDIDTPADSLWNNPDSIRINLDSKLHEFYRLKSEISTLLQNKGSEKDLDSARVKIAFLQQRIEELRNRTLAIESENKKLNEIVRQLSTRINPPRASSSARRDVSLPRPLPEKNVPASALLTAADIRLSAWTAVNGKEVETTEAGKANRISGSFTVRNPSTSLESSEIMVVVTQPDGKVLRNSDWETGSFQTQDGRKIYSARIPFDYSKGESRRLNFTLNAEELPKGEYKMQVYHNGSLVGKSSRFLN